MLEKGFPYCSVAAGEEVTLTAEQGRYIQSRQGDAEP
jgi:hypothetical protein